MTETIPPRIVNNRGECTPGMRAKLERARELDAALLDNAAGCRDRLWYAHLPAPRPDGCMVIGGWRSQESATMVLERLGYKVVMDVTPKRVSVPKAGKVGGEDDR